jgi:tRNA A-37 threonylcarbamoyl transferase component Bud32
MGEPPDDTDVTRTVFDPGLGGDVPVAVAATPEAVLAALRAMTGGERYQARALIGKGGMGEVRVALDRWVGREVAIKTLTPQEGTTTEAVSRFIREARVQGLLDHPAIVPIHDLGIDAAGRPFFVMKRVAGVTLAEVLTGHAAGDRAMKAKFARRALLARFADVCLAIEFAHTRGVVHRDLKPTNIMLGDFGEAWVLDWGVAKLAADAPEPRPPSALESPDTPNSGDTAAGTVLGTPGYIAPEQISADTPYDHRVDIYALGCVLFEILAGEPLHPRGRAALRSTLRGTEARPSVRRPDRENPPELDAVVLKATALDPDSRYQTVRQLHDDVLRYLDGDRDLERRRALAVGHSVQARAQLELGERAAAMREAGQALALDPTDAAALGIVTRLMIEPPAQMPAEVERDFQRSLVRAAHTQERAIVVAYWGFGLFIPLLFWLGLKDWTWLLSLGAIVILTSGVAWSAARIPSVSVGALWVTVIGTALVLAMLSRIGSSFLLAAGLVPATAMAFVMHPASGRPWKVVVVYLLALGGPLLLEHLGVLSTTYHFTDHGLLLHSPVVNLESGRAELLLTAFCLFHVVSAGIFASALTREQRDAWRQLHLQAWHLQHLVPGGDGPSAILRRT